jgi:tetratricopeptide (TPR) repeat protein
MAARAADDRAEAVPLLTMISHVHGRLGDGATAVQVAREAIVEAERSGKPRLIADAQMRLGSALLLTSPADAIPHYQQALALFIDIDDRRSQGGCHINIGVACDRAGNHSAAEVSYATALDIGREVKAADLTALASMNLGVLLMMTGRFAEARQRYEEALRLYTSINNEPFRLTTLYNLAHLARERGDAAGATELYGAAKALAERLGQLDVHVGSICGVGLAELALGQHAAAAAHLDEARALLDGRDAAWFQGREVLEALGIRLQLERGQREPAMERLRGALMEAERHDQYATVWLAAECASGLRDATGSRHELLQRYAAQARTLGYSPLVKRLEAAARTS